MRKLALTLITLTVLRSISLAQDFPDFGSPTKEELALTDCSFEKGAAAVVLIHEAYSYSESYQELTTSHHVKIKILKQSGVNAGDISIRFYRENDFERIIDLEAVTINTAENGQIIKQKVDKKSIYHSKINQSIGEINFAFPSIKIGSIIEYQYKSVMKSYRALRDWYFQAAIPVVLSRYHLKMVDNNEVTFRIKKRADLEATVATEPGRLFFEMRNIPPLNAEPYMDARNDNLQRVNFQAGAYNSRWSLDSTSHAESWRALYYGLLHNDNFWGQLQTSISGTSDFIRTTKQLASPEEKMKVVHDYVRSNMIWNNVYAKMSGGVNEAWKKREGTSADINLILVNLLQKVSVNANPVLVSERFNGKVDTAYPFIDQFNNVFASVVIDNKEYFLNATDKYTPAHVTPATVLNTIAFVMTPDAAGIINISNDTLVYKEGIYLDMKLSEGAILSGTALSRSKDYARIKKLKEYIKDKEAFKKNYELAENMQQSISNFQMLNIENDSLPLEQKFEFSMDLSGGSDYKSVSLDLFSEFEKNPFVSDNRFSNINFGFSRAFNINVSIQLPANFVIEEIPKSIRMETPEKDIVFSRQTSYNKESNSIFSNLKIEFNRSYYERDLYPFLKDIYKKIFAYLDERVVLKRK